MSRIVAQRGMASFKAKFPVLQELFAKKHRGPFAPPPPSGRGLMYIFRKDDTNEYRKIQVLEGRVLGKLTLTGVLLSADCTILTKAIRTWSDCGKWAGQPNCDDALAVSACRLYS